MASARVAPLKDPAISWSPQALQQIRTMAVEGLLALPQRGIEVGGLLLGTVSEREPYLYSIETVAPIECEHQQGPGFYLSEEDRKRLSEQLAEIRGYGEHCVVGYFRSRTARDSGPELDDADRELIGEFFSEPSHLFMSLRPMSVRRCEAAVFHYSQGSLVQAGEKFDLGNPPPFQVQRREQPQPASPAAPVPKVPTPHLIEQPRPIPAEPVQVERVPVHIPLLRTPIEVHRASTEPRIPHEAQPPSTGSNETSGRSLRFWRLATFTLALLVAFLAFQRQNFSTPNAQSAGQQAPKPVKAEVDGKTVELTWDPAKYRIDFAPQQPADGKLKIQLLPAQPPVQEAAAETTIATPTENPDEKIVQRALALDLVEPVIPDSIRNRMFDSITVRVRVQVNENGAVISARPAEYSGGLERYLAQQAADAARSVRFRPAMSAAGRPLPSSEELTVEIKPR